MGFDPCQAAWGSDTFALARAGACMSGDPLPSAIVYAQVFSCDCLHTFWQLQSAHLVHSLLYMIASGAICVSLECSVH